MEQEAFVVLLVENNRHDARLIKKALKRSDLNCTVIWKGTGAEALSFLSEGTCNVVILDYQLHDMDGLEILQRMHAGQHIYPTIFVTGQGSEQIAAAAIKMGAQDYIVKDLSSDYLSLLPLVVTRAYQQWQTTLAQLAAEEAVRQSEETLRSVLTSMGDLVIAVDAEGRCLNYFLPSPDWSELLPAQPAGLAITEVLPASAKPVVSMAMQRVSETGESQEFDFAFTKNGDHAWYNVKVSQINDADGEFNGATLVVRDVTARVLAQKQLLQAYERQAALAKIELAINRHHELRDTLMQIVQTADLLLPTSAGASILIWDAANETYTVSATTLVEQTQDVARNRARRQQGATRWIIDNREILIVPDVAKDPFGANPMLDEYGLCAYAGLPLVADDQVVGVLYSLARNIHHYSRDEVQFLEALARRAALVISKVGLFEQLQAANKKLMGQQVEMAHYAAELEQQNLDLDAFAHTVAHDLKTPLSSLHGFAELLTSSNLAEPEQTQALTLITNTTLKMGNIVDALLFLAQVRQVDDIPIGALAMAEIVEAALMRLAVFAQQYQPQLTLPGQWETARGYAPWIEELWVNLLSNAYKYGGEPPIITLGSDRLDGDMIRFWIRDSGPGLDETEQQDLFAQSNQPQNALNHGHGLGLSIVQRIAQKCGGTVGVESEIGVGSTFWFTLPAVATHR